MDTDVARLPQVQAVMLEVDNLETYAKLYQVKTAEQYEAGADDLKRVKAAQKKLDDTRTEITGPMNAALKAINNLFRTPTDRLARIERTIKQQLGVFADEQDRLRRVEQQRAEAVAQRERERLEAQAAKAAAEGKDAKAEQLQERAAQVVAPVSQRAAPKVAGVTSREVWKFEIIDAALLPREYLAPDEQKLRQVVVALKGDTKIAGVRVYAERQYAAGSV